MSGGGGGSSSSRAIVCAGTNLRKPFVKVQRSLRVVGDRSFSKSLIEEVACHVCPRVHVHHRFVHAVHLASEVAGRVARCPAAAAVLVPTGPRTAKAPTAAAAAAAAAAAM